MNTEKEIKLSKIVLHKIFSIRRKDNMHLENLDSMKTIGCIHPPVVRPKGREYELISGFRRYYKMKQLKWKKAKFSVRKLSDKDAMLIVLSENHDRVDNTPIEEAICLQTAIEELGLPAKEVAKQIKKSEAYVSNRIKLLQLDEKVKQALHEGKIKPGHAEHGFFKLMDYPQLQKQLLKETEKYSTVDSMGYRARGILDRHKESLRLTAKMKKAMFPKCPKCKERATGFNSYPSGPNLVRCKKYHGWDCMTGEDSEKIYKHETIKAAVEKRKKMLLPRTSHWDISIEKVLKLLFREAIGLLKDASKDGTKNVTLSIVGDSYDWTDHWSLKLSKDSVTIEAPKHSQYFKIDKNKERIKVKMEGLANPSKKDYVFLKEILQFPDQVTHSGKPLSFDIKTKKK